VIELVMTIFLSCYSHDSFAYLGDQINPQTCIQGEIDTIEKSVYFCYSVRSVNSDIQGEAL